MLEYAERVLAGLNRVDLGSRRVLDAFHELTSFTKLYFISFHQFRTKVFGFLSLS